MYLQLFIENLQFFLQKFLSIIKSIKKIFLQLLLLLIAILYFVHAIFKIVINHLFKMRFFLIF